MLLPRLQLRLRIWPPSGPARDRWWRGVRLRRQPRAPGQPRAVWHWIVDIDRTFPALTEHLAQSEGYTVEDPQGRRVGMVVSSGLVASGQAELVVFLNAGARVVVVQDIAEIAPGAGVLVLATEPAAE